MRIIFAICAVILVIGGVFAWRATQLPDNFGEFTGAQEVSVHDVVTRPEDFRGKVIVVRGSVTEQCKTMGCYFFFAAGEKKLRVELKDIAMDAPWRQGRPARVEGQIVPYGDSYELYASAVQFE
jgi:hypothetical protein